MLTNISARLASSCYTSAPSFLCDVSSMSPLSVPSRASPPRGRPPVFTQHPTDLLHKQMRLKERGGEGMSGQVFRANTTP